MKALFAALAMILATPAFATSIVKSQEYVFQSVSIDGQQSKLTGVVTLDYVDNEITVRLFDDMCGELLPAVEGEFRCMAAAVKVSEFSVKMESKRNSCGSYIYEGKEDLRPVDGLLTQISFEDHRQRLCENYLIDVLVTNIVTHFPGAPHPSIYSLTKPAL